MKLLVLGIVSLLVTSQVFCAEPVTQVPTKQIKSLIDATNISEFQSLEKKQIIEIRETGWMSTLDQPNIPLLHCQRQTSIKTVVTVLEPADSETIPLHTAEEKLTRTVCRPAR